MGVVATITKPLGQAIPYTPTANVAKGDVVVMGSALAIAIADISANVAGFVQPEALVSLPKATSGGSGAALAFGTQCYWDATNVRVSSSPSVGVRAGVVVTQGAADSDTSVSVLLRPFAPCLPAAKFTTDATGTQTADAGDLTGAEFVVWKNTANGAVTLTTRTATQMFGDLYGASIGMSYFLRIVSAGDNTVTITAGSGITAADTMTVATMTTRDYIVTINTATTMTMRCVGAGTYS